MSFLQYKNNVCVSSAKKIPFVLLSLSLLLFFLLLLQSFFYVGSQPSNLFSYALFGYNVCACMCMCVVFNSHLVLSFVSIYPYIHISISIFARCFRFCCLSIDKVIAVSADKRLCNNVSQIPPPCIIPQTKLLHDTYLTNKI